VCVCGGGDNTVILPYTSMYGARYPRKDTLSIRKDSLFKKLKILIY